MPSIAARGSSITCFDTLARMRACTLLTTTTISMNWRGQEVGRPPTSLNPYESTGSEPGTALACFGVKSTNTRLYYVASVDGEDHIIELAWLPPWGFPPISQRRLAPQRWGPGLAWRALESMGRTSACTLSI